MRLYHRQNSDERSLDHLSEDDEMPWWGYLISIPVVIVMDNFLDIRDALRDLCNRKRFQKTSPHQFPTDEE